MKPGLFAIIAIAVVLLPHNALGQTATNGPGGTATDSTPAPTKDTDEKLWSFSASAYVYFVPEDRNFVSPIFTADRNKLHLEARYNYENLDTASVWVGRNFSFGKKVTLDLTLMLGGVFGDTDGIAPGYEGTLTWRKLVLYSEGEYVFDSNNSSDSFLYTWSELSWSPKDWFRFGLVVQRTKLYQSDLDIQRGLLIGFAAKKANFTAYVFNPDQSPRTVVLSVGGEF